MTDLSALCKVKLRFKRKAVIHEYSCCCCCCCWWWWWVDGKLGEKRDSAVAQISRVIHCFDCSSETEPCFAENKHVSTS